MNITTVNLIILGAIVIAYLIFAVYCLLNFFPNEEE